MDERAWIVHMHGDGVIFSTFRVGWNGWAWLEESEIATRYYFTLLYLF